MARLMHRQKPPKIGTNIKAIKGKKLFCYFTNIFQYPMQSGSNPTDWKTFSKLFLPLLRHCRTISIGTLYSPLQFGVNTRCKRELMAFWLKRIFPGSGLSADASHTSGMTSRSPPVQGVAGGLPLSPGPFVAYR